MEWMNEWMVNLDPQFDQVLMNLSRVAFFILFDYIGEYCRNKPYKQIQILIFSWINQLFCLWKPSGDWHQTWLINLSWNQCMMEHLAIIILLYTRIWQSKYFCAYVDTCSEKAKFKTCAGEKGAHYTTFLFCILYVETCCSRGILIVHWIDNDYSSTTYEWLLYTYDDLGSAIMVMAGHCILPQKIKIKK